MVKTEDRFAVFIDIDGTLTADGFVIPRRNLEALAAARALGHMIFINTGRSLGNIPPEIFRQIEVDGVVAGCGSSVSIGGEIAFLKTMPEELVRRAAGFFLKRDGVRCVFEGLRGLYLINARARTPEVEIHEVRTPGDVAEIYLRDEIQVMAVGGPDFLDFLKKFGDEIDFFPFENYADCVSKGLNKAKGIERTLKILGLKRENSIAIGDGGNDYPMLEYAGIGVAVKNARPEILKAADYVAASNEDCGVAEAIEKFLL